EVGAEQAGETFQLVQGIALLERFGIQLNGGVRGVAAGTAAGGFLGMLGVGRRVGAQEELRITAGGGVQQRVLMHVALEDRQAIKVRADAADQHMVAVVQQVVGGDGGADVGGGLAYKLRGIGG